MPAPTTVPTGPPHYGADRRSADSASNRAGRPVIGLCCNDRNGKSHGGRRPEYRRFHLALLRSLAGG